MAEYAEQHIKEEIGDENPWIVTSLYQFQFFCCPGCVFRVSSKQEFVDHTLSIHPESLPHLIRIDDDSLSDIICPWDNKNGIKNEDNSALSKTQCDLEIELKPSPVNEDIENFDEDSKSDEEVLVKKRKLKKRKTLKKKHVCAHA